MYTPVIHRPCYATSIDPMEMNCDRLPISEVRELQIQMGMGNDETDIEADEKELENLYGGDMITIIEEMEFYERYGD